MMKSNKDAAKAEELFSAESMSSASHYTDVRFAEHDFTDEIRRRTTGPTMHAECSASDVIQGEQDRTGSPPDADCGPGFTPGPSATIAAMIADGWIVRD